MMVILDERRRWLYPTIECVLLEYKEKRRPLTKEDIGSCLKEKGVRSSDTLTNNIYVAHDFGYLYDLGDNKDVKRLIELGYRDLKRIHGRGKLIPTVLALVDLAIYNIIHETLKELNIRDNEVIKSILRELTDEVLDAMDDVLDAILDALSEVYLNKLKSLGVLTVIRSREAIVIRVGAPGENWGFECKGRREDLEDILNCVDKKWKDIPGSIREKLTQRLMEPGGILVLMRMAEALKDALNGRVQPIHPSLIDHYMGFMETLLGLTKYRLRQEREMRERVHKEVEGFVKEMFSEEKKA
jgi:hypothetical protein